MAKDAPPEFAAVIADARSRGMPAEILAKVEALYESGRLRPVRCPDGSLGIALVGKATVQ